MAATAASPDLSEFYKLSRPKKKPCTLGLALAQLESQGRGEERDQLVAALTDTSGLITVAAVSQWLAARTLEANHSAVVSHRRGTCSCSDE